jgi:hypothetical protein
VFLKTRKTGGTSVEIALSALCNQQDIITPITPRDEFVRLTVGVGCQNFSADRSAEVAYLEQLEKVGPTTILPPSMLQSATYSNHMSYKALRALHPEDLEGYRIITIERHPYEKAVSLANFALEFERYKSSGTLESRIPDIQSRLEQLLESGELEKKIRNWKIYTLSNRIVATDILRFEHLDDDYRRLVSDMQCSELAPQLPRTKVGGRDRSVEPKDILSRSQRQMIQDICAEEFEHFAYVR